MADNVVIRPVGRDERAAWEPLWNGYLAFYEASLAPGASDVAWERFHDSDEPMFLLGAYVDGQLTGIVQYLFHGRAGRPATTAVCRTCLSRKPRVVSGWGGR
jgi:hypothetical protein